MSSALATRYLVLGGVLLGVAAVGAFAPACREDAEIGRAIAAAREHWEDGDRDLAVTVLENARSRGLSSPFLDGFLGMALVERGRHAEAVPLLEDAVESLESKGEDIAWRTRRARDQAVGVLFKAYVRLGDCDSAVALANRRRDFAGSYISVLLAEGYPDAAEVLVRRQLDTEAIERTGWQRKSLEWSWVVAAIARDDFAGALRRWEEVSDDSLRGRSSLLPVLAEEGARALAALSTATGEEADRIAVQLASLYLRVGLASKAAETIRGVLERGLLPDRDILPMLGEALEHCERRAEATQAWASAVQADPGAAEPAWRLARLLKDAGRISEALEHLERVVQLAPERGRAWVLLGDCARRVGDLERSCAAYRRGIALLSAGQLEADQSAPELLGNSPMDDLLRACRKLGDQANGLGWRDDELLAWNTVLELASRPGKEENDPPPGWLAERARYRVFALTGVAPPPLPGREGDVAGAFMVIR